MIHVLKGPTTVSLTDQVQSIVRVHGARAVLLALARVVVRHRREQLQAVSGIPPTLRRDVGLPPEPEALRHWMTYR